MSKRPGNPATSEETKDNENEAKRPRKSPPTATTAAANNKSRTAALSKNDSDGSSWDHMFFQLMLYHANQGDFNVPSKIAEHKNLWEWIKVQRQEFKLHQAKDPSCKLTKDQILVLKNVQFPLTTRGDDHWKRNYENLIKFKEVHGHLLVPRLSEIQGLGDWVTDQRRQLKALKQGKTSLMTPQRQQLLDDIGFVWEVRNRPEWDDRFQQLVEYKEKLGNTCVPQFYKEDRGLGKWVAKQREQYKLKRQGKHSFLTADREEQLLKIGFVWSVKGNTVEDPDIANDGMDYQQAMAPEATGGVPAAPTEDHHQQHDTHGQAVTITPNNPKAASGLDQRHHDGRVAYNEDHAVMNI